MLTIKEGGAILFGGEAAQASAGIYVPFVVWFNILAGFAYVVAGAGTVAVASRPLRARLASTSAAKRTSTQPLHVPGFRVQIPLFHAAQDALLDLFICVDEAEEIVSALERFDVTRAAGNRAP